MQVFLLNFIVFKEKRRGGEAVNNNPVMNMVKGAAIGMAAGIAVGYAGKKAVENQQVEKDSPCQGGSFFLSKAAGFSGQGSRLLWPRQQASLAKVHLFVFLWFPAFSIPAIVCCDKASIQISSFIVM